MTINEFTNLNQKKLLLTDHEAGVNKLVRHYSEEKMMHALKITGVKQLAEELFTAYMAIYEPENEYRMISPNMQSMRLTLLLKNMEVTFLSGKSKTVSAADEILKILNQFRCNTVTEDFENSDSQRICELKKILELYEKTLMDNHELDGPMVIRRSFDILEEAKKKPDPLAFLSILLPNIREAMIGVFYLKELNDNEKIFLTFLSEIIPTDNFVKLAARKEDKTGVICKNATQNLHFFKAYGIYNETQQVLDILSKNKIPFGDTVIIYPNTSYERVLMGKLSEAGIPFSFPKGFAAASTEFVGLLMDFLDFAAADFAYKNLYSILANPVLRIKKAKAAYRAFLKEGIGYGYQRYMDFFQVYDSLPADAKLKNEEYQDFYAFLKSLMLSFTPGNSCEKMYTQLLEVARTYSYNEDFYRACIKDSLDLYASALSIWKGESREEDMAQIQRFLTKLKCRVSETPDAVTVLPYGSTDITDRNHLFVMGLSNENIASACTESPVLCDVELARYATGNIQLAMERNKRNREALLTTFHHSLVSNIYCSYSYYDTVSLIPHSPSVLFQELLDCAGIQEGEIPSYGYEIYTNSLCLKEQGEVMEASKEDLEELKNNAVYFSASSLQNLIHCPLSYYYEKILRLPKVQFQERTPDKWLAANVKGNVFHHVLEAYANYAFIDQNKRDLDEKYLQKVFEEEIAETVKYNPIPSQDLYEIEKEDCYQAIYRYVAELHQELKASPVDKKIIGCEVPFQKLEYSGELVTKEEKEETLIYSIQFAGSVDRLDGYVDEAGKLHLQIYDYKTGSLQKKKEEIANGNQIQHHIYALAMMHWARENQDYLEKRFQTTITDIEIASIEYLFPYEEERLLPAEWCQDENGNVLLPNATENILFLTVARYQAGDISKAIKTSENISRELLQSGNNICGYCSYQNVCRIHNKKLSQKMQ